MRSTNTFFFVLILVLFTRGHSLSFGKRIKRQKEDEEKEDLDVFTCPDALQKQSDSANISPDYVDYPCSFPLVTVENFGAACEGQEGDHFIYHPYMCDIQCVLTHHERKVLDRLLSRNFSTCFCSKAAERHQCHHKRNESQLSAMLVSVQHAKLMSKVAFEMSGEPGEKRPELVIKWRTESNMNEEISLPKPFCTFNGPHTISNAAKFYARWIRQKWAESLGCELDLLILIIREADLIDKISRTTAAPIREYIGLDFDREKLNETNSTLLDAINSNEYSYEQLTSRVDRIVKNLNSIKRTRYRSRKEVKDKPAPMWAVLLLFGCAFGGLLLACVGNWVSSRGGIRNRAQHVTSGADPSWKVKFSSSAGAKPAAAASGGGGARKGLFAR